MTRRELRIEIVKTLYKSDLLENDLESPYEEVFNNAQEVVNNLEIIDSLIEESLDGYSLNRLSFIDRAIVRLATYEMKFTEVPYQIVINEAIEITKELSDIDDKQYKFNNKLLENIKKRI